MQRSTEEILTTHTGSLPRPPELTERAAGRVIAASAAPADLDEQIRGAVAEVVAAPGAGGRDASSTTARRARSATRPTSRSASTGSAARAAWAACRPT